MKAQVVDTVVHLDDIKCQQLIAAGIIGVSRYVAPSGENKRTDPAEFHTITSHGLDIQLNWEDTGTELVTPGYPMLQAALSAQRQGDACGYHGAYTYSADLDITITQYLVLRSQMRAGPLKVHGPDRVGLYGSYDLIEWAYHDGLASYFWQSMSFSYSQGRNGKQHPRTNIWQRVPSFFVPGPPALPFDHDYSGIITSYYGQQQNGAVMQCFAKDAAGSYYLCDGMVSRPVTSQQMADIRQLAKEGILTLAHGSGTSWEGTDVRLGWYPEAFGLLHADLTAGGIAPTYDITGVALPRG